MKIYKRFTISVAENHRATYETFAENAAEALKHFTSGASDFVDGSSEFIEITKVIMDTLEEDFERDPVYITKDGHAVDHVTDLSAWLEIDAVQLDELVHDYASANASETNNGGVERQLRYLERKGCPIADVLQALEGDDA